MAMADGVQVLPVTGIGEVAPGTDIALLVAGAVVPARPGGPELLDGDVLVVTQKIVSKAEGRLVAIDHGDAAAKLALVLQESVRVLRRRGDLVISETRHGFICANAGVDLSNVAEGSAALLPDDPDRSARRIRAGEGIDTARPAGPLSNSPSGARCRTAAAAATRPAPRSSQGLEEFDHRLLIRLAERLEAPRHLARFTRVTDYGIAQRQ